MSFKDCVERKLEEGLIDGKRTDELMKNYNENMQKKLDLGMNEVRASQEAAEETFEEVNFSKVQKKRQHLMHTQLALERVPQLLAYEDSLGNKNPGLAITNFLDFDPQGKMEAPNISMRKKSYMKRYQGTFFEKIEEVSDLETAKKTHMENVVRAAYGEEADEVAQKIYKGYNEATNVAFNESRLLGAMIPEREDWNIPNFMFDWKSVRDTSLEEWKADIKESIDVGKFEEMLSKENGQTEDIETALNSIYENIISEGDLSDVPQSKRSGIFADKISKQRVFPYETAEDWLKMHEKYGKDTIFNSMRGYLKKMARNNAILDVFGPKPKSMIATLKDKGRRLASEMRKDNELVEKYIEFFDQDPKKYFESMEKRFDNMWDIIKNGTKDDPDAALNSIEGLGDLLRNTQTFAHMGGAAITSLTDYNFSRATAKFNGLSQLKVMKRQIKDELPILSKNDYKLARRTKLISDYANAAENNDAERYIGWVNGNGANMAKAVVEASLLNRSTRRRRMGFNLEFMGHLADMSKKSWSELANDEAQKSTREALERNGITKREWNKGIKGSSLTTEREVDFFQPHKDLNTGELSKKEARELGIKLHETILTEQQYAVPSYSLRSKSILEPEDPSKVMGQAEKAWTQFKSFPVNVHGTHVQRGFHQTKGWKGTMSYLAGQLLVGGTLYGALSLSMDILMTEGKDPTGYIEKNPEEFFIRSMLRSGGLGIFGDILSKTVRDYGKGFGSAIAGPGFSFLGRTGELMFEAGKEISEQTVGGPEAELGEKSIDFLEDFTPNLWYGELAKRRILIDTLRKWNDPEATENMEEDMEREREKGYEYYWERGEALPTN